MSSKQKVTKELVFDLATMLSVEGIKPTVIEIRQRNDGSGSFSTISKYLKEWEDTQNPLSTSVLTDTDVELLKPALERLWVSVHKTIEEKLKNQVQADKAFQRFASSELDRQQQLITEMETAVYESEEKLRASETRLATERSQNESLSQKLSESEDARTCLEEKAASLADINRNLESSCEEATQTIRALNSSVEKLEEESAIQEEKLTTMTGELSSANQALEESNVSLEIATSKIVKLEQAIKEGKNELNDLSARFASAQEDNSRLVQSLADERQTSANLTAELDASAVKNADFANDIEAMQNDAKQREKFVKALEADLEKAVGKIAEHESAIEKLNNDVVDRESELSELQEALGEAEAKLSDTPTDGQITVFEGEINTVKEQLAAMRKEKNTLNTKLAALMIKHDGTEKDLMETRDRNEQYQRHLAEQQVNFEELTLKFENLKQSEETQARQLSSYMTKRKTKK
ncbi:DNA-binding protein [Enterovibrio norvegicus]|uniref:DNA-binding protein n=1 Tax=Enterovibrio norvegicus TaxID=188144 RepID=UPI00352DEFB9